MARMYCTSCFDVELRTHASLGGRMQGWVGCTTCTFFSRRTLHFFHSHIVFAYFALRNAPEFVGKHVDLPSNSKLPRLDIRPLPSPAAAAPRRPASPDPPRTRPVAQILACRSPNARLDVRHGSHDIRSLPQFSTCSVLFELARLFLGPTWATDLPSSSTADPGRSRSSKKDFVDKIFLLPFSSAFTLRYSCV